MDELLGTEKHDDLIFDVGMHRGEDTEFYLKKGFRVVGFEADPDNVSLCRTRFADAIRAGRLHIVAGAIADAGAPQTIRFYKNELSPIWGTLSAERAARNERFGSPSTLVEVDTVNFALAIERHGVPHYMKTDIEGADLICVNAFRRFRHRPDYVSIESDKSHFVGVRHELDVLLSLGYDRFQAVEQSEVSKQRPPMPAREGVYVNCVPPFGSSGLFGAELGPIWKTRTQILRQYRKVFAGYALVGDTGILNDERLPGVWRLRRPAKRIIRLMTGAAVPGWYDTHARHSSVTAARPPTR